MLIRHLPRAPSGADGIIVIQGSAGLPTTTSAWGVASSADKWDLGNWVPRLGAFANFSGVNTLPWPILIYQWFNNLLAKFLNIYQLILPNSSQADFSTMQELHQGGTLSQQAFI